MKRFIVILAALLCMSASAVQAQTAGLSFGKYTIAGLSATSFTSLDGTLSIQITNSDRKMVITNISGVIYKGGMPFVIGTADDLTIVPGTETYDIRGHASLASMTALFALLSNPSINPADYTFDAKAEVKRRRKTSVVERKGIPLSAVLKL